jgi:hypothetical protein
MIRADALIVVRHFGLEIEFSDRLLWVERDDGSMALVTMQQHAATGRVTAIGPQARGHFHRSDRAWRDRT